ncbi:divalent cation transporter [Falsiroseomonas bella]|uniref:Divalent cation transporter n=1 Tax=Falsiroseomonas bella TaxID=2184016 RepID=A0A317FEI6_9PROT|nr:divalent cation transporter [Falsiroseomonas bella]
MPPGLGAAAAAEALRRDGPNAVPEERPHPLRHFATRFWGPVPWMLEAAIVLQLALGETTEAMVVAALLVVNAAVGAVQERRADAALEAMRARLAPQATVRRDGAWESLPAAMLVAGDVVKLGLGAVVPADVRILSGEVALDESMLTGESAAVRAGPGAAAHAGALVRGGEAVAEVTATGPRTFFGRAAELVRIARAEGTQERAMVAIVRLLAVINGAVVVGMLAYAAATGMELRRVLPLVLSAVLATVPVALSLAFTLTAAMAARALARRGVLLTRLGAVHDAATMTVLCSDKTGTLTRNDLAVAAVAPLPGFTEADVLALAALASSDSGPDGVDAAVRAAAVGAAPSRYAAATRHAFLPFDPARRFAEAEIASTDGALLRVVKGAPAEVAALSGAALPAEAEALARQGYRVMAVAAGDPAAPLLAGLLALGDPPRPDAGELIARLRALGVRTVMITGDGPATAAAVAVAVGLRGEVRGRETVTDSAPPADAVGFAALLPEDKLRLVRAFQRGGHAVGMCGDGVNDAPALRQAQMGIAVSSATDVAKSAAAMVLTEPGLGGVVAAVEEGRAAYRRLLTYAIGTIARKVELVLLLALGLLLTGHAVLTPMLMVLFLALNDLITLSLSTDRTTASARPAEWRVPVLLMAGGAIGLAGLGFTSGTMIYGVHGLGLGTEALRTLTFLAVIFATQAALYATRDARAVWRSRPGGWLMLSSALGVAAAVGLAMTGTLMAPLPPRVILGLGLATVAYCLLLDAAKRWAFPRLGLD